MDEFEFYKSMVGQFCFIENKITGESISHPTRESDPFEILRVTNVHVDLYKKRKAQTGWEERYHLTPEMCEIYKLEFVK